MEECHNHFRQVTIFCKHAVLIGSQLGIYSCLVLRKKKELKGKGKKYFRNTIYSNYQKIFNSDHAGQCPVHYLENSAPATEHSDWLVLIIRTWQMIGVWESGEFKIVRFFCRFYKEVAFPSESTFLAGTKFLVVVETKR